ncbi:MAG TPA: sigma-70 family RNA polymerase sigma factor [Candidatus Binatia bacterium]
MGFAAAEDPDGELVRRVRGGDRSAFNQLVLKYRSRVMGVAARMLDDRAEAEDLAQDVFVRVYRALGDFKGEALFSTWLYRVTANACLNRKKKRQRERRLEADIGGLEPLHFDPFSNPHVLLERKQLRALLERLIQALPEEQRMVLILRDVEGLSYDEIADCLGVELGTVRSRLHRARAEVQARVKALCPPGGRRSVAL